MPTVPKTVQQATGGLPREFPGSPQDLGRGMAAAGKAAVESVLPGASDAAAARDSYLLGQQIGPALREGRYQDAIRAFLDSTTAALGALPMVPSLAGVTKALRQSEGALDMSQEARLARAKEMGFDTQAYHGTNVRESGDLFSTFDPEKIGSHTGPWTQGFYFTDDPSLADQYAKRGFGESGMAGGVVLPVKLRMQKPFEVDFKEEGRTGQYGFRDLEDAVGYAKATGHDSAIIRNWGDARGSGTQYVVFEPSQVRSAHATFDPAKRGSGDILAGVAGTAVAGGAAAYALSGGEAQAAPPKPAAERAAEGLSALADPAAWLKD